MEDKNNNVSELEQLRAQVKDLQEQAKKADADSTYWWSKYCELKEKYNTDMTVLKYLVEKMEILK